MKIKFMFIIMLITSIMISISSNLWLGMWMGLELNLFSFIPLMMTKNNLLTTESMIKYFIIQAISSSILILAMIVMIKKSSMMKKSFFLIFMNTSMLIKMGMVPFHFWIIEVFMGLSWMNCLIMLTWQKIIPMILMDYSFIHSFIGMFIISINISISSLNSLNLTNMRKLLMYSSINHSSWILSMMMINSNIWINYFILYSMISISLILMLNMFNIFNINQFIILKNKIIKILFSLNFINFSGMPPMSMFFLKWIMIQSMINNKMIIMPMLMIIFSLLMNLIYLKISIPLLLINKIMINSIFPFKMKFMMILFFMSLLIIPSMLITYNIQ